MKWYSADRESLIFSIFIFLTVFVSGCSKSDPAPAPIASFTWSSQNLTAPATVSFTNTSINGSSYVWDFGDGGSSTLLSPTYTYSKGGTYTVRLTVNGQGGTNTSSQSITILSPTVLEINIKNSQGTNAVGASVRLYPTQTDWLNET